MASILAAHDPGFLPLPVAGLFRGALVVELLADYECQLALHHMAFPVELQGDAGMPFVLGARKYFGDLFLVEQQLARTIRLGDLMGAGRVQGGEVRTQQPGLAILDQDISIG